jgi:hypothetical protein
MRVYEKFNEHEALSVSVSLFSHEI